MKDDRARHDLAVYIVFPVLFFVTLFSGDGIAIFRSRPDILLIFIVYLTYRLKPGWVICCAFAAGFLQDIVMPGNIQYWGLSPLLKTLFAYAGIRFSMIWADRRGPVFYVVIGIITGLYFILYDLMYYSGYAEAGTILLRYALPEFVYTLIILFLVNMILPVNPKNS